MFGRQRIANERDEAIARAEAAEAALERSEGARTRAEADRDELKHKYEQPVVVRQVLPTATETNRHRH